MTRTRPQPDFQLPYQPSERARPFNVLLIVIDDLRGDHLACAGYERDTAPNLERRLSSGTYFSNCHSPVGWTLPSCASIVTGQMPDTHTLVNHNHRFQKPKIGHFLGDSYFRAAITNNGNVVTDSIGRETLEKLGFSRRPAKWKFFNWDAGFDDYTWFPRENYEGPFDTASKLVDNFPTFADEKPWFLFFHSNVVHDYHLDRECYLDGREWIGEDIHPGLVRVADGPEIWREPPPGLSPEDQARHMIAKYDAGIRYMDRRIDDILSRVDFEETIVVFMSDHGEGFDPLRGRVHHCGRLHSDLTHVPLAIWLPSELRESVHPPTVEQRFCSTLDLAPTLLTLLGDAVAGFPGRFLFDLPTHRILEGSDRGYIYWNEDCVRESYDTCRIEIRSEMTYPLKRISVRKNNTEREYAYHLGYDPAEHINLLEPMQREIENFEPISFVVALNDRSEFENNLRRSPVANSPFHEWLVVENQHNGHYSSISALYQDALENARHDLVFFIHQDVYLPVGWEERMFRALRNLEQRDASWGVLGAVGALAPNGDQPKQLRGHWCDPSGYYYEKPLPHAVQSLDEQWLGVRKSRGVHFDPALPGFHCYGIDLSLTARDLGLESYAIDAFVWHKYRDPEGYLVSRREDSEKILRRWSDKFMAEFLPSANYVESKWKKYLPFQTTSWNWDAP